MFFKHPIFDNVTNDEFEEMISCGCVHIVNHEKGSILLHTGDKTNQFGIVLSGEIYIESIDLWGNRMILHRISSGGVFGETYALSGVPLMVDVTVTKDSKIAYVNLSKLLMDENQQKLWYSKVVKNLLMLSVNKNLLWSERVFCISAKSIRSRVMNYLSAESVRQSSTQFDIPFDRQQMADYLNVERSALSKELGRMQKEGILTFKKRRFQLHCTDTD